MWVKDVNGSLINLSNVTSIEIDLTISSHEFEVECENNPEFVTKTLQELPCHQVGVVIDGERRIKFYLNKQCSREDCQEFIDRIGASLNGRELIIESTSQRSEDITAQGGLVLS